MKTEAQHIDKWSKDCLALFGQIDTLESDNARLKIALRELLEYTGGSDLVEKQPSHPIAKAIRALNSTK